MIDLELEAAIAEREAEFWEAVASRPCSNTEYADHEQWAQIRAQLIDSF
jgi:hypothetical protein